MAFFINERRCGMKKYEIVKTHEEFNDIIKNGKYFKNSFYNIYIRKNNENFPRFGIAVGKKLGNAVFRNKMKRRIRMILTSHKKEFSNSYDYIIIMKEKSKIATYQELDQMLLELLSKRR